MHDARLVPPSFDAGKRLIRYHAMRWLTMPGMTSVGVGRCEVDRTPTDEIGVQFTVRRKLSSRELKAAGALPVPKAFRLDDGRMLRTDVAERAYRRTHFDPLTPAAAPASPPDPRRARLDPVRPGGSIGHFASEAGTIAAVVWDAGGVPHLLSNWHVLAGPGISPGQDICQPGVLDSADEHGNRVGSLVRRHLSLAGDGAICSIEGRTFDDRILELDVVPRRLHVPEIGDPVVKCGRTTGVTRALVSRVNVVAVVSYPQGDRNISGFEVVSNPAHPPGVQGIAEGGDSGSMWMIDAIAPDDDIAVGLQVCGRDGPLESGDSAIACYLGPLLDRLGVTLRPGP
ncbi:MAG: hypothetical protein SFY69_09100 [Planctomycetota bacterium]|nr:hypothetical protein [Planctomycetota bacterium]